MTTRPSAPPVQPGTAVALGMVLIVAYVAGFTWAIDNTDFDVWGGFLVAPVLLLLSLPLTRRMSQNETDPRLRRIILWALVAKLAGTIPRYLMVFVLYNGAGDSARYAEVGARYAEQFRNGFFAVDTGSSSIVGTSFMEILTGWVFTFTGPTILGGYLVFSWLSFWGLYCFYRAFCIAVPTGNHRRYALLVLLLPSLLFWPSSIGKEGWMLFTLGLASYGAAKILTRARGGYVLLGVGLLAAGMVRPHMAALVVAALGVAYLLPRRVGKPSAFGPIPKVLGAVVLLGVCAVALTRVEAFFGTEVDGASGVEEILETTAQRTDTGTTVDNRRVRSPADLPAATLGVLFRPFPWEADSMQTLAQAAEGMVLALLILLSWGRLRSLPRTVWRNPYLVYAIVFVVLFVVAFSSLGNVGILARQRTQMLPFFLVFLAAPMALPRPKDALTPARTDERTATA